MSPSPNVSERRRARAARLPARLSARLAAATVAVSLAACAGVPTVPAEVARFHRWTPGEPMTVSIRSTPEQAASLESRSYEQRIRERLAALGFAEASPEAARYRVEWTASAAAEPRRTAEWWMAPAWGPGWGPGWGIGPGPWIGPGPLYPAWRWDPFWAMPPTPVVRDLTVWRHEVRIDLYDQRADGPGGRKVHEARATAVAATESLPRVVPGLVDAALAEFPGESGGARRVEVPLSGGVR